MANTIATARPVQLAPGGRALSTRARGPGGTSSHFYTACFLLAVALVLYPSVSLAAPIDCGLVPHWVNGCPAGQDRTDNSGAVVGISFDPLCAEVLSLVLHGPSKIDRKAGENDSIVTEILSMDLNGGGVRLLAGTESGLNNPSNGLIVQQGDPFILADSYFDVYFRADIDTVIGGVPFVGVLFNQEPVHVTAVISRVPPPNNYLHPVNDAPPPFCLPLYPTQDPLDGQTAVAYLAEARHTLAIRLPSFSAAPRPGAIELSWKTEVELESNGFNVLRSTTPDGGFQRVNRALIAAGGGPAFGAGYNFIDDTAVPYTSYYYLLEDVDTSGVRTLHGAGACTMNVDPECKPLAVTITPETKRPRRNLHD
ncbi:MAG: hypothetical protein GY856_38175 [bacterium]|nr:hypothetical protein [bacterium]